MSRIEQTLTAGKTIVEVARIVYDYADHGEQTALDVMNTLGRIVDNYRRGMKPDAPHVATVYSENRGVAICTGCECTFAGPKRRLDQSVFQHRNECEAL